MAELRKVRLSVDDSAPSEVTVILLPDGRMALPLPDLASQLGYSVIWDEAAQTVQISRPDDPAGEAREPGFTAAEQSIISSVDDLAAKLQDIALDIFRSPERGNTESRAAALLSDALRQNGFTVEQGLRGVRPLNGEEVLLDTAFKASREGMPGGPTIAIMLEYDALPMGHACGHNLIAASGLGAALALGPMLTEIPGRLVVMGTPAEEGGPKGGKIPLLKAGYFAGTDLTLITHPGDRWDTGSDWLAVAGVTLSFTGLPSHAAAAPERGISALDAAMITYTAIETIREHVRSDARIHGIVSVGGQASNIVPEKAELKYGVRALDRAYLEVLKQKVENCARAGALATGAQVDIAWSYGMGAPINVPALDRMVLRQARRMEASPLKKWTALGSSDLGDVGYEIPTSNLWFAIAPEGVLPHTHEFMAAAGSQAGFAATLTAAKAIALAAYELYCRPELVSQIQADFRSRKAALLAVGPQG